MKRPAIFRAGLGAFIAIFLVTQLAATAFAQGSGSADTALTDAIAAAQKRLNFRIQLVGDQLNKTKTGRCAESISAEKKKSVEDAATALNQKLKEGAAQVDAAKTPEEVAAALKTTFGLTRITGVFAPSVNSLCTSGLLIDFLKDKRSSIGFRMLALGADKSVLDPYFDGADAKAAAAQEASLKAIQDPAAEGSKDATKKAAAELTGARANLQDLSAEIRNIIKDLGGSGNLLKPEPGEEIESIIQKLNATPAPSALEFPSGQYNVTQNFTVPETVSVSVRPGAKFAVAPTAALKFSGLVTVDPTVLGQIFSPTEGSDQIGAVSFAAGQTVLPEWWGAVISDANDDTNALKLSINSIPSGGMVRAAEVKPEGTYQLNDNLVIGASNVTLDLLNNYIESPKAVRIYCNGDVGGRLSKLVTQAEREAAMITNCKITNFKIGRGDSNAMAGPSFVFCKDCVAENITKLGKTGTGFHTYVCNDCILRNITNSGSLASDERGAIGILVHMSERTLLDNITIENSEFTFGLQMKGGEGNILQNSVIRNITLIPDRAGYQSAFVVRGDAPWKESATATLAGEVNRINQFTYPYGDIDPANPKAPWLLPDARRASRGTILKNNRVEKIAVTEKDGQPSSRGVAYRVQEATDTTIDGAFSDGAWIGIALVRTSDGEEQGLLLRNFNINNNYARGLSIVDRNPEAKAGPLKVRIETGCISMSADKEKGADAVYRSVKTAIIQAKDFNKAAESCSASS